MLFSIVCFLVLLLKVHDPRMFVFEVETFEHEFIWDFTFREYSEIEGGGGGRSFLHRCLAFVLEHVFNFLGFEKLTTFGGCFSRLRLSRE